MATAIVTAMIPTACELGKLRGHPVAVMSLLPIPGTGPWDGKWGIIEMDI
jgi:hypothetical protein